MTLIITEGKYDNVICKIIFLKGTKYLSDIME